MNHERLIEEGSLEQVLHGQIIWKVWWLVGSNLAWKWEIKNWFNSFLIALSDFLTSIVGR